MRKFVLFSLSILHFKCYHKLEIFLKSNMKCVVLQNIILGNRFGILNVKYKEKFEYFIAIRNKIFLHF